jgi:hypothetical protein
MNKLLPLLALGLLACGDAKRETPTTTSVPTQARPAPQVCRTEEARKNCSIPIEDGCPAAVMRPWTPACRREAFDYACADRCFTFETDEVLLAAASDEERRPLLTDRIARNRASLKMGEELYARMKTFVDHIKATEKAPRGLTPECMTRMRAEFAKADAFIKEIDEKAAKLPEGFINYKSPLAMSKSCASCSDDGRATCADVYSEFADRENMDDMQKELVADEAALKALK